MPKNFANSASGIFETTGDGDFPGTTTPAGWQLSNALVFPQRPRVGLATSVARKRSNQLPLLFEGIVQPFFDLFENFIRRLLL